MFIDSGAAHSLLSFKAASSCRLSASWRADIAAGGVPQGIGRQLIETWIARFDSLSFGGGEEINARLRVGDIELLGEADTHASRSPYLNRA